MINQIEINNYWEVIKYNYDQIRYAEVKASIVISIYSLFFSLAYTIDILDSENTYEIDFTSYIDIISLIIVLPGLYYTFVAVSACVRCFLPRLSIATKKSPLFFGDIGTGYNNFESYLTELDKLMDDQDEYHKHLSQMIFVTGKIAHLKFINVNKAMKSLLTSLLFYMFFLIGIFVF